MMYRIRLCFNVELIVKVTAKLKQNEENIKLNLNVLYVIGQSFNIDKIVKFLQNENTAE